MLAGIDEEIIRKVAIKTKGGSEPLAMDADGWRRILCSNKFDDAKEDLRKTIANFVKKICTEKVPTVSIEAFVACRLISLVKTLGLRPIGVEEILCRITVIVSVLKKEVVSSAGSLQVCAGQEAGSEAAIRAMEKIFKDKSTEAVLLVMQRMASTQSTERHLYIISLFYALLYLHLKRTVIQHQIGHL